MQAREPFLDTRDVEPYKHTTETIRDQKLICRVPACASSLTFEGWTCDYMAASPLHQSSGLTNLWCVDGGFHLKMSEDV